MNKAILVFPVVLSFVAHLAFAADTAPPEKAKRDPMAEFKAADTNGDGGLSQDELAKTPPNAFRGIKEHFTEMDANKDGKVTPAEGRVWEMRQRYKNGM